LFTSAQQQFLNLVRGTPGLLPPPVELMDRLWLPHERAQVERVRIVHGHGMGADDEELSARGGQRGQHVAEVGIQQQVLP
jgi:hypothetical protein